MSDDPKTYSSTFPELPALQTGARKMRPVPTVFENFPAGDICPVCHTNDDGPTVLVGLEGTEKGFRLECKSVHLACAVAEFYNADTGLLYRTI